MSKVKKSGHKTVVFINLFNFYAKVNSSYLLKIHLVEIQNIYYAWKFHLN